MKTTNMKLFGNAYLDPNARATPDNQQEILEGFGADYQRIFDACADGRVEQSADATNQQFHDACEAWLAQSNAEAAIRENELLAEFGARTLAILSNDHDWSTETLAEIARAADALQLSKYDDEGFFQCGIEGGAITQPTKPTNAGRAQHARTALKIQGATESADTQERLLDMLADLMHLSAEEGIDFANCIDLARIHFETESAEG